MGGRLLLRLRSRAGALGLISLPFDNETFVLNEVHQVLGRPMVNNQAPSLPLPGFGFQVEHHPLVLEVSFGSEDDYTALIVDHH